MLAYEKGKLTVKVIENNNYGLAFINFTTSGLYAVSSFTSVTASITYHIHWNQSIIDYLAKKTYTKAFINTAVSVLVRIMATRALLLAINFDLELLFY